MTVAGNQPDPMIDPSALTGLIEREIVSVAKLGDRYQVTFAPPKPHEYDMGCLTYTTHADAEFDGIPGRTGLGQGDRVLVQWMHLSDAMLITRMEHAPHTMTVKELSDFLATCPPDAKVSSYHPPRKRMDGQAAYHSAVESAEFVDYNHEVQLNGRSGNR